MSTSKKKILERTENALFGVGFLLKKIKAKHEDVFGEGTRLQVEEALKEIQILSNGKTQRERAESARNLSQPDPGVSPKSPSTARKWADRPTPEQGQEVPQTAQTEAA